MGHPIRNVHRRTIGAAPAEVGAILDTLASRDDRVWPYVDWPPLRFDRALGRGAAGGHGPIRYTVEVYVPGRELRCRFTAPAGFDGSHAFTVTEGPRPGTTVLEHFIVGETRGLVRLTWPLVFRPLHNALIEDALAKAARSAGRAGRSRSAWTPYVRVLRAAGRALDAVGRRGR